MYWLYISSTLWRASRSISSLWVSYKYINFGSSRNVNLYIFFINFSGPEYSRSNLIASIPHNDIVASWQRLSIEFILTLVVIQVHHITFNQCKWNSVLKDSSVIIGITYSACSLASVS